MDLTYSQFNNYIKSLKNPDINTINKTVSQSISETDIMNYFGYNVKNDIITYSQLDEYKSIEELLPESKSWKIILIEEKEYFGHWVLILRYNNTIEFFNSYGTSPSYELDLIPDKQNEILGQDEKYLNKLLNIALGKFKIIYNKKRFQRLENNINTCGRWVILRIIMLENFNMDLNKFIIFMDNLKKPYKLNYDQLVSMIIF